jgi:D-tagatose-1,6-bisphosphate aldolase subunit GatZ/KbaZ
MSVLDGIVARNRAGEGIGLPSYCTAHPETLAAILRCYRKDDAPVLIEATCNQVNQSGGYTGMTPAGFRRIVEGIATKQGVAPGRLILGGDHLGPNPWKADRAEVAMDRARAMVAAYVAAGFTKIHLDASMPCADDGALAEEVMAMRAADLAAVAEAAGGGPLRYVIGTEVPVPGGETERVPGPAVTRPEAVRRTLDLHRAAFAARGLAGVMDRVVAVVVQPGVDFGNDQVVAFDPARAAGLCAAAPGMGGPLYEAHSTDYQTGAALAALVAGHFPVLKVGPELTFAFRQAVFALADIAGQRGAVEAALRGAMRAEPAEWRVYVDEDAREDTLMLYGLSDRVRYFWPRPVVRQMADRLFAQVRASTPAPGVVAQATGGLVGAVDPARLPEAVAGQMVGAVVAKYRNATGG